MKKLFSIMAIAVLAAVSFTSCSKDDDDNGKEVYIVGFEEDDFSDLIDSPEYNGPLLYSGNGYSWTDKETTLTSSLTNAYGDNMYWGGGIAISNYVNADETIDYKHQLSVPVASGSKNFAVVYDDNATMSFADGKAHVVEGLYMCPTTYLLNNIKANYKTGYYFIVKITGTKANGSTTSLSCYIAQDTNVLSYWAGVDLSSFGAVTKISFSFEGSDTGVYGLNTPKYIAIDNVIVDK